MEETCPTTQQLAFCGHYPHTRAVPSDFGSFVIETVPFQLQKEVCYNSTIEETTGGAM